MNRDEQWLLDEKYGGKETAAYEEDKKRLAEGEPLAYVIGSQPFLGLKIYLDSKPLIPRPETEWWTERLVANVKNSMRKFWPSATRRTEEFSRTVFNIRALDLCAGSGAIGCAFLKLLPDVQVFFGEIDPAHEMTIQKNIHENQLNESRSTIGIGDLFEPFGETRFDIIAANPPYIPSGRKLQESVADYEPSRALFSGADGLDIIRRIAEQLPGHLAPDGIAWIECDENAAEASCALFESHGLAAEIRTDQYDKPRFIVVSFPQ